MNVFGLFAEWVTPALWEKLFDASPILTLLVILWFYFAHKIGKEHERHLKCKDQEIERLVEQRNRYETIIFGRRLSTLSDVDLPGSESPAGSADEEKEQEHTEQAADAGKHKPKGRGKKKKHD